MNEKDFSNSISVFGCVRHWRQGNGLSKILTLGDFTQRVFIKDKNEGNGASTTDSINLMTRTGLNLKGYSSTGWGCDYLKALSAKKELN